MSQSPSSHSKQPWADVIASDRGEFMRAFAHGDVRTDDIDAPSLANVQSPSTQAVTGTFTPGSGTLTVLGDSLDNSVVFSRTAAGQILVNGGAVVVKGPTPTVANTVQIQAFGQAGNDAITLEEANGALPAANLFGGAGNDTLTGGSGADLLFGQSGDDILLGRGGADALFGGSGNDRLTGGDGNDQMFGEAGNDRMIWNPGDDSDLMEGGDGVDTAEVNGGNGNETFTITANGSRVRFDRTDPAPFSLDIGSTENLVLNANGGDDVISASGDLSSLIQLTIDGGAGNDQIRGGNGNDTLRGGDGNDFIDGNQGSDVAFLGTGDDVFQWDPGDGSDTVEGEAGSDTLQFNGSNIAEKMELTANGERVRMTRDIGGVVMDLNGIEHVAIAARGGTDAIDVNDLTGTAVTDVTVDLAGAPGATTGDGAADGVSVEGTNAKDTIDVLGSAGSATVLGLTTAVTVNHTDAIDTLSVKGGGGDDTISAVTLVSDVVKLDVDGGAGNDTILGSRGDDRLSGGDGNDFIDGNQGSDIALLGAGDDVFQWDPGDGSDTVEGEAGTDDLLFNGANIAEKIDISANGTRARFTRDIGGVTMDLNGVERIDFVARGGADDVVVHDLSGTDVTRVAIDLSGTPGSGDGAADTITVQGGAGDDHVVAAGDGASLVVNGFAAEVNLAQAESSDRLVIDGGAGADTIDASGVVAGSIVLELRGGAGADVISGSSAADLVNGGTGNDVALMGAGDDTFVWNPGDASDTVEGQAGFDTLQFNGANVAESIEISANGGHVRLARDIGGVTMDLNGVEQIDVAASGAPDRITVDDLAGTDATRVSVDLGIAGGVGDGASDTVTVKGGSGDDVVTVVGDATGMGVLGLAAEVDVQHAEAANDTLEIVTGAGDDVITGSGLAAGTIRLVIDAGDGDDILLGGAGSSVLRGGAGDDILIGGPGDDVLDGGPGNDVLIGGGGNDTFLDGNVQVQGFQAGAGFADRIDLRDVSGLTFDWLMAHAETVDGNAVLDLGNGEHMTLVGVEASSLAGDDFLLGG